MALNNHLVSFVFDPLGAERLTSITATRLQNTAQGCSSCGATLGKHHKRCTLKGLQTFFPFDDSTLPGNERFLAIPKLAYGSFLTIRIANRQALFCNRFAVMQAAEMNRWESLMARQG